MIWEDILLSSAHCIIDLEENGKNVVGVDAWIGLDNQDAKDSAEFRQIELGVPHPKHNSTTEKNDIIVFKLIQPVLNVTYPMLNMDENLPTTGESLDVFGFGLTTENATTFPTELQTVTIEAIAFDDCNDANSYNGSVYDRVMICAGLLEGGKDACSGE